MAIALTVRQPRNAAPEEPAAGTKPTTKVDVLASAFDAEGRVWGTRRLSVKLGLNAGNRGSVSYEILPRLTVSPGKYKIRVAVRTEDARSGSVYTFVDVPDFSRSGVSLSGIVLEATPAFAAAPPDAYADLLPVVPTARRDFGASDRVSAFVRVYQGGSHALVPATLTTRIVDAKNEQITKSTGSSIPRSSRRAARSIIDSICRAISRRGGPLQRGNRSRRQDRRAGAPFPGPMSSLCRLEWQSGCCKAENRRRSVGSCGDRRWGRVGRQIGVNRG